jgi:hypothetical protein
LRISISSGAKGAVPGIGQELMFGRRLCCAAKSRPHKLL